jgi:hypothetical protein
MLSINELNVSIYFIAAVAVIFLGTKFSTPGATRVFAFATLFSIFFSMGLMVGHGAIPFPGLWILGSCWYTDSCSRMYGDTQSLLLLTLVPMLVQWMIILTISFIAHYMYKRMELDLAVSNDMGKETNKHKFIIGIVWLVVGVAVFLIPIMSIASVYFRGEAVHAYQAFYYVFSIRSFVAILHISAGYFLLKNRTWAHRLCLPISVLSLLSIPVGTALGAYYLWYYFVFEKQTR